MRSGQTGSWWRWALGLGVAAALGLGLAPGAGAANIWVVDNGSSFPPDFFTIQDAIDFASPGDTIVVRTNSTYTDPVVIDKDNLTVVGAGDTEIRPVCGGSQIVLIQASGVRFQGFHLVDDDDCFGIGIDVTGSDNWVVANWIENTEEDGIHLGGDTKRNTVLGNWVTGADEDGIDNGSGPGWGHLIAYNVVSGAGEAGIRFQVRKVTVDYNVSVNNDSDGIDIDDNAADQFKVTNNIALDNDQDGSDEADLDRESGATGTFTKNVFEFCQINDSSSLSPCPAF